MSGSTRSANATVSDWNASADDEERDPVLAVRVVRAQHVARAARVHRRVPRHVRHEQHQRVDRIRVAGHRVRDHHVHHAVRGERRLPRVRLVDAHRLAVAVDGEILRPRREAERRARSAACSAREVVRRQLVRRDGLRVRRAGAEIAGAVERAEQHLDQVQRAARLEAVRMRGDPAHRVHRDRAADDLVVRAAPRSVHALRHSIASRTRRAPFRARVADRVGGNAASLGDRRRRVIVAHVTPATASSLMTHVAGRYVGDDYAPAAVAERCGIAADTIERLAREMAHVAFQEAIETADRMDRRVGTPSRQGRRAAGRDVRDARHLRAFQRLPDVPRAASAADAARRARRPRQFQRACAVSKAHPAAPVAGDHLRARQAADSGTARLPDEPRRSRDRRARRPAADRQGVLVGIAHRRPRADAHGDRQRCGRRSVSDRHAAAVHGEHGVELGDEHGCYARPAVRTKRGRLVQDPVRRRLRRVRVGDRCVRRSRAAGYDLSRTLRRDLAARPPDLRARCARRRHPSSDRATGPRCPPVAGRADRARVATGVSGVHARRRPAQIRRLPRFHHPLRACARHRFPRRLARRAG